MLCPKIFVLILKRIKSLNLANFFDKKWTRNFTEKKKLDKWKLSATFVNIGKIILPTLQFFGAIIS